MVIILCYTLEINVTLLCQPSLSELCISFEIQPLSFKLKSLKVIKNYIFENLLFTIFFNLVN